MKRRSTAILSVLCVVLAAFSGYLSMENRSLKVRLANSASLPVVAKATVEEVLAEAVDADVETEAVEGRRGRFAEGEQPTPEEIMERRKEQREKQMAAMLERFSDPEMRMEMIEGMMGRLDRGYAEFFKRLNLPADQINILKTLMAEQSLLRMEGQVRASMATGEERNDLRESMKGERDLLDADIVALLGEKGAESLKKYSNTLEYRGDVETLERSLSYTESPLTKRQSEGLVNAYAKVDQQYDYTVDLNGNRGGRGQQLTKDTVDTYYQERSVYEAALLEEASKFLNDAQLASLAEKQLSEYERDLRQSEQQLNSAGTDGGRGGFRGSAGGFRGGDGGGGRGGPGVGRGR